MKKFFETKCAVMLLASAAMFASCSDDNEGPRLVVVDFENTTNLLAGPTSYGDNLYANYEGAKFIDGSVAIEPGVDLTFGINYNWGDYNFYNGGVALSQWNYRSDIEGQTAGWWYGFSNQCSVYNTASVDGANRNAGNNGSNTFAVVYGYGSSAAHFDFSNNAEYIVAQVSICPSSYLYGCITEGNAFGNDPGKSLEEAKGWFKVLAYGFDAAGNPTNGGQPVEKYICDYRDGANPRVDIATTWQSWNLSALGEINSLKFDFEGSDTGAYGLNTPGYICLDDICVVIPNE